jgi:dihydropteroate synthase
MNWQHATGTLPLDCPRIFGIVNVTPDSFSDGGRVTGVDDARRLIDGLITDGADAIDIGGESTRPQGAVPVSADDELRRVIPVIVAAAADHPGLLISVDTVKARVAGECVDAGASIVNDVSGFRLDAAMPAVCASSGAGVVLMHSRGDVADMATFTYATYGDDPVGEIVGELRAAVARARGAGIAPERVVVDPGIGFSKRSVHSVASLRELHRVIELGFPVMVGVSRKRFIGELTDVSTPSDRVAGTVGANVAALDRGARLFRVHDVKPNREALDVAWAIAMSGR